MTTPRIVRLAAAQMGATNRWDERPQTLNRMIALLRDAASQGAQIVLFPEIAFTTFFPRYLILDEQEIESWFEHGDIRTAPSTRALFDVAHELGVDVSVGFAEATDAGDHYNSCIYYQAATGSILAKYRKIHLPGDFEPLPDPTAINQLEKRYFLPGDLGFRAFRVPNLVSSEPGAEPRSVSDPIVGMMICNDRRWAESWRLLGLQGVEIVLCGYNTIGFAPQFWGLSADMDQEEAEALSLFHHKLVMQCHSYTNSTFSVSAARCGLDDGLYPLIGGSTIVDPDGRILAESTTVGDEVIVADCDLARCVPGKTRTFDFARHRRIEHYQAIATQTGVIEPSLVAPETTMSQTDEAHLVAKTNELQVDKKYRILLINPNSTKSMTDACLHSILPTLPPDVLVDGFTAPNPSPTAIEGAVDSVLSAATTLRALLPVTDRYDAFLVACYSDHPLIRALREELSAPVVGILEASLFAARTLGGRFGVVSPSARSVVLQTDAVRAMGFEAFCVGVESCGLGVLGLESKEEKVVVEAVCTAARKLVEQGADTVTLGCAGMSKLKSAVERAVGDEVQVVDGVVAGVQHLAGLLRIGARTASKGVYASARVGRMARGQTFF